MDSMMDPDLTVAWSKYSCVKGVYIPHVAFAYLIMVMGIICFITRAISPLNFLHPWFGRGYILAMIWCIATSLLIHNSGLPDGVVLSFLWVLIGLTVGWVVINIHQVLMNKAAIRLLQQSMQTQELSGDLAQLLAAAKRQVAHQKSFLQRLFSWKALHGVLFLMSWVNIIGRIFATPLTDDFICYTYPYYKQFNSKDFEGEGKPPTPLPTYDPDYDSLPWGKMGLVAWGVALSIGPIVGGFVIGAIWSWIASWRRGRAPSTLEMKVKSWMWHCTGKRENEPLNRSFTASASPKPADNIDVPKSASGDPSSTAEELLNSTPVNVTFGAHDVGLDSTPLPLQDGPAVHVAFNGSLQDAKGHDTSASL